VVSGKYMGISKLETGNEKLGTENESQLESDFLLDWDPNIL
jgi:hypothetical protein